MTTLASSKISTKQQIQAKSGVSTLVQSMAALGFGAMILFAVGFLPMAAAHNAAHDTRHVLAFPCH